MSAQLKSATSLAHWFLQTREGKLGGATPLIRVPDEAQVQKVRDYFDKTLDAASKAKVKEDIDALFGKAGVVAYLKGEKIEFLTAAQAKKFWQSNANNVMDSLEAYNHAVTVAVSTPVESMMTGATQAMETSVKTVVCPEAPAPGRLPWFSISAGGIVLAGLGGILVRRERIAKESADAARGEANEAEDRTREAHQVTRNIGGLLISARPALEMGREALEARIVALRVKRAEFEERKDKTLPAAISALEAKIGGKPRPDVPALAGKVGEHRGMSGKLNEKQQRKKTALAGEIADMKQLNADHDDLQRAKIDLGIAGKALADVTALIADLEKIGEAHDRIIIGAALAPFPSAPIIAVAPVAALAPAASPALAASTPARPGLAPILASLAPVAGQGRGP